VGGKITRESWELIAENIVHIVKKNSQDYDAAINELEDYLTDEAIITVVNEVRKCKWCTKERCELRDGVADNDSCNGTLDEMLECNIVANNAEYDNVDINEVIKQWYKVKE